MSVKELDKFLMFVEGTEINESILDEPRDELNTDIWDVSSGTPEIRSDVEKQVLNGLSDLSGSLPLEEVFIVGSITGYRYNDEADLDVTVVLGDVEEGTLDTVRAKSPEVNGRFVEGTTHPINYFVLGETPPMERFDSAYDMKNHKWLKPPKDYGVDVSNVYDDFKKTVTDIDIDSEEALRSLIDIDLLTTAIKKGGNPETIMFKIMSRLEDLDTNIKNISATYDEIHTARIEAFSNYEDSPEPKQLPSANLLPENVRYKLLERYHYLDMMHKLSGLVKETGKIDTPKDIEDVEDILKDKDLNEDRSEEGVWIDDKGKIIYLDMGMEHNAYAKKVGKKTIANALKCGWVRGIVDNGEASFEFNDKKVSSFAILSAMKLLKGINRVIIDTTSGLSDDYSVREAKKELSKYMEDTNIESFCQKINSLYNI